MPLITYATASPRVMIRPKSLCAPEKSERSSFLPEALARFDDLRAGEDLHHHPGGDDGGDAELFERAALRGEDHAHPVEGVRGLDLDVMMP